MGKIEKQRFLWKSTPRMAAGITMGAFPLGYAYYTWLKANEQVEIGRPLAEAIDSDYKNNIAEQTLDDMRGINPNAGYGESPEMVESPDEAATIMDLEIFGLVALGLYLILPFRRNPKYNPYSYDYD